MKRKTAQDVLNKKLFLTFFVFAATVFAFVFSNRWVFQSQNINKIITSRFGKILKSPPPNIIPTISPYASPSPTPTPKPLTFQEMTNLYGPCVHLPVFYYHHIQSREVALAKKQTNLTVYTDVFQSQMQYLKDKGYNVLTMNDLISFFDNGTQIPARSILLTFDDGYGDFYTDALPILQSLGFRSTMFTVTGLVNNPDYLTWDQISQANGSGVLFANHTWSHKSLPSVGSDSQQNEITLADTQLSEHGLNNPKIFAYPYGGYTSFAASYLKSLGYNAAFGTIPGSVLCKKQRFDLPRVHIGNVSLFYYGF